MPSQLYTNDKISFVCAKNFTYRGHKYEVGDDFDQHEANNIETMVRSRYLIPVVEELTDKPRHWHRHVRPRAEVLERLGRDRVQLRMPHEPDSDDVVNVTRLTHPHTTPDAEELAAEQETQESEPEVESEPEAEVEGYDPGEHTVAEVNDYLDEHPEEREAVVEAEANGKARKGILEPS